MVISLFEKQRRAAEFHNMRRDAQICTLALFSGSTDSGAVDCQLSTVIMKPVVLGFLLNWLAGVQLRNSALIYSIHWDCDA